MDTTADAIITINPQDMVISWNKGAQEIFGYLEKEAIGANINILLAKNDVVEQARSFSDQVFRGEQLRSIETIRYDSQGKPHNVLLSATPIISHENKILGASLIYKDIAELKKAHEQIL